ncbi:ArgE/DapE family deacylase [Salibacterium lacus]|uniref:ArgE/DapE family deacylase n=1 Tax=Salibacterium lacus TaxID=1898109 RepID=A0ABW5SXS1_9BACI
MEKQKHMLTTEEWVDHLWEEEKTFLQEIGRIPSESGNEKRLQLFLADYLENELGMETAWFTPDIKKLSRHPGFSPVEWGYEGSPNVIGTVRGKAPSKGKSLIFQGHVDVVSPDPVSMWSCDPWGALQKDNKMYARGILDMKAGVTAMIFAYKALQAAGCEPASDFMIQCVVDEERTGNGALAALEEGYTADAALIPEPFGQNASTAQLGSIWFRITLETAEEVNVAEKGMLFMQTLEAYENEINQRRRPASFSDHEKPVEVCIGTFNSGDFPSNVPKKAVLECRCGVFPGHDPADMKEEVKERILTAARKDSWLQQHPPDITFFGFHAEGMEIENDQTHFFHTLDDVHEKVTNTPAGRQALPVTTDARFFNLYYDIPAVCYGPDGGNIHGVDEWVDLDTMKEVTKVYAAFLADWCGVVK